MVTVNTVVIDENGILVLNEKDSDLWTYEFPGGQVRAGQETMQFAAIRHIKEQIGISVKKDALIPVDFRSDPERSDSGNVVDIGFVVILDGNNFHKGKWLEVDFKEKRAIIEGKNKFSKENQVFLKRALDVALMVRNI